jgi:hypothetical protein
MTKTPDDSDSIETSPDGKMEKDGAPSHSKGEEVSGNVGAPKRVRRLKANELVSRGDLVDDGHRGLELWVGPGGFRADAFLKPIYRQDEGRPTGKSKKPK